MTQRTTTGNGGRASHPSRLAQPHPLTGEQEATLEALERFAVRWGYSALTRTEQRALDALRAAYRGHRAA